MILEERLGELEQEKQEFAEYEQLERQRRALEYSSYHLEFQKVRCVYVSAFFYPLTMGVGLLIPIYQLFFVRK